MLPVCTVIRATSTGDVWVTVYRGDAVQQGGDVGVAAPTDEVGWRRFTVSDPTVGYGERQLGEEALRGGAAGRIVSSSPGVILLIPGYLPTLELDQQLLGHPMRIRR